MNKQFSNSIRQTSNFHRFAFFDSLRPSRGHNFPFDKIHPCITYDLVSRPPRDKQNDLCSPNSSYTCFLYIYFLHFPFFSTPNEAKKRRVERERLLKKAPRGRVVYRSLSRRPPTRKRMRFEVCTEIRYKG